MSEALLVIEAYRALRDRAPFPPDQVVGDLEGGFAFIVYDNHTHKIFVASVSKFSYISLKFYWFCTQFMELLMHDINASIRNCIEDPGRIDVIPSVMKGLDASIKTFVMHECYLLILKVSM
mgnify:FL=1